MGGVKNDKKRGVSPAISDDYRGAKVSVPGRGGCGGEKKKSKTPFSQRNGRGEREKSPGRKDGGRGGPVPIAITPKGG